VLQWLREQGDLLGSMLAFVPTPDALQGLGLASQSWRAAVNGALPHVTINWQLPAGASFADRFPSLTSLHVKRLPAGDLPALLVGGLSHRLVRLTLFPREDWGFRNEDQLLPLLDAFREVFVASDWPWLEHLGLNQWLYRFLDKAPAHPTALAQLRSLGVVSGDNLHAVARAVKAGLLPNLRTVETGREDLRRGVGDWLTVLEHAQDTRVLRIKISFPWRRLEIEDSDDSGSDADDDRGEEQERLTQLLTTGVMSRMR
jgi:hypothetical protein